jgi:hypothetical protein
MFRADPGAEVFRRAALFLGAGLLGIQVGAWFSRYGGGFIPSPAIALAFAAGGLLCAFRFHDRWLRAAFVVFALEHMFIAAPLIGTRPIGHWLPGASMATFALFLLLAGARRRSVAVLAAAAAVFVAALVLKIVQVTR